MRFFRSVSVFFILILAASSALSQTTLAGKVVEVIDGTTVVIEQAETKARLTVHLEFIEVPEPDQPLAKTVKEHVEKMLVGNYVSFTVRRLRGGNLFGKIYLNEIDVSQQLLRDGAAWYSIPEKADHDATEREAYLLFEAQAKLEKRGVWGVENLKPAWEFRAEKAKKESEIAKQTIPVVEKVSYKTPTKRLPPQPAAKLSMWEEVRGGKVQKYYGVDGIYSGYHEPTKVTYLYTEGSFLDLGNASDSQKIEFCAIYAYLGSTNVEKDIYVIGFLSDSKIYQYAQSNSLSISVDKKPLYSSKGVRFSRPSPNGAQELLLYKIKRSALEKIIKSADVGIKIGATVGSLPVGSKNYLESLLKVTN